jgi:hypothetical protein
MASTSSSRASIMGRNHRRRMLVTFYLENNDGTKRPAPMDLAVDIEAFLQSEHMQRPELGTAVGVRDPASILVRAVKTPKSASKRTPGLFIFGYDSLPIVGFSARDIAQAGREQDEAVLDVTSDCEVLMSYFLESGKESPCLKYELSKRPARVLPLRSPREDVAKPRMPRGYNKSDPFQDEDVNEAAKDLLKHFMLLLPGKPRPANKVTSRDLLHAAWMMLTPEPALVQYAVRYARTAQEKMTKDPSAADRELLQYAKDHLKSILQEIVPERSFVVDMYAAATYVGLLRLGPNLVQMPVREDYNLNDFLISTLIRARILAGASGSISGRNIDVAVSMSGIGRFVHAEEGSEGKILQLAQEVDPDIELEPAALDKLMDHLPADMAPGHASIEHLAPAGPPLGDDAFEL